MKKLFILSIANLCFVSCATLNTYQPHPAVKILEEFQQWDEDDEEIYVIPYFVNLMSIYKLDRKDDLENIHKYIIWYLSHLNYPDKYGFTGTMYDYNVSRNGREKPAGVCDSVDSYSATFLILIYHYYQATGDKTLIEKNRKKLEDIAYTIPFLQDRDGLTTALPDLDEKYLMDNCETYGGISAFINLSRAMGWETTYYEKVKKTLRNGILKHLYDKNRKNFYWAIEDKIKHPSRWTRFYPDSYAQLFPILFGLLEKDPELKRHLWEKFNHYHKNKTDKLPAEQKIVFDLTKRSINNESTYRFWNAP